MSMNVPIISGKDSKNYSHYDDNDDYYYYYYYYYYHYYDNYRQIIVMNTAMKLSLC